MQPNDFTPERLKQLSRLNRNRDFCAGSDSVKASGTKYIRKQSNMSDDDYFDHLDSIAFFPAAARTLQSHIGLVFRKQPTLTGPDLFLGDFKATAGGKTIEQVARWCFSQSLIANDGGLLIDHPTEARTLSLKDSIVLKQRPFIGTYDPEDIREITKGEVGNSTGLLKVRLMDDVDTVRWLELIDGIYTVIIYKNVKNQWQEVSRTVPLANGAPMNYIPFVHLNDGEEGAPMDDICALNKSHYKQAARLDISCLWASRPIIAVAGVNDDVELHCAPDAFWRFKEPTTNVKLNEFVGSGVGVIERNMDRIEGQMAQIGSRMLASEKAAAEANETLARRQASENSILAAMARHVSAKMTEALTILAAWMALAEAPSFALSNDFIPTPMDSALLAQLMALNNAGKLSDRQLYEAMQRGELVPEAVSFETHQDELETQGSIGPQPF